MTEHLHPNDNRMVQKKRKPCMLLHTGLFVSTESIVDSSELP